eukprot:c15875_g1_i1.p1 GENE.c15875_g1_i1~~c15875_g1_i1.p1  ORF type:complete len:459 (+),score=93.58 c15875_g1_i1:30-1406(+)
MSSRSLSPRPGPVRWCTNFHVDYKLGKHLGKGAFGEVREGIHRRTNQKVAVKIILPASSQHEKMVKTEVEVLAHLHHPHIASFIAAYEDPIPWYRRAPIVSRLIPMCFANSTAAEKDKDTSIHLILDELHQVSDRVHQDDESDGPANVYKMYIVMELMLGDSLFEAISKRDKFSESAARDATKTIVDALAYMHSQQIVHRDIKPSNIVFADQSQNAPLKLVDFGASVFHHSDDSPLFALCGTLPFMAPEMFKGDKGYGAEVDMWALGVLVYMLLSGILPFDDSDPSSMIAQVCAGELAFPSVFWSGVSEAAVDFVKHCLTVNPSKRMTPEQAQSHSWMVNTDPLDKALMSAQLRQNWASQRFAKVALVLGALNRFRDLVDGRHSNNSSTPSMSSMFTNNTSATALSVDGDKLELDEDSLAIALPTNENETLTKIPQNAPTHSAATSDCGDAIDEIEKI